MFIASRSKASKLRQERNVYIPLLTELGGFLTLTTINISSLTGLLKNAL